MLSPVVYALLLFGLVKILLLQWSGLGMLGAAVLGTGLIYWAIDPKLRAVSAEYEGRQADYATRLERRLRWCDDDPSEAGG